MGCNISRPELRGRGKDPGLLSFNNHNADEAPRRDPIYANTQPAVSTKFVIKQIVGRNSDVSTGKGKKDFVLGDSNELLLPEKDKEGQTDHSPPPPPSHVSSLHDAATRKSPENPRADALKHPKTNHHNHTGNDAVDSEGRGAVIPKFEGPLWIASPSFRDYCNTAPLDANSDDDDGFRISVAKDNNNDVENRSHRENLTHPTKNTEVNGQNHTDVTKDTETKKIDENTVQHNDSTIQVVKRRRNLRKVLTLHRPAAVRNLFSVGTCYNPLASSVHNGARKPPHSKPV